eukprot:TRINITY_DN1654_c0_g1_i2.p1 TRINITY_DN1654_c0_g1~~TRINITY_DN1654_c0_g1_i2.p1  ORF type:complete len:251 (-),score=28.36 TRINITY_DN1654_c0_g1_i2:54-806(-)
MALILCTRTYLNGGPPVCNRTLSYMCELSAPQYNVPWWDIAPELPSGVYIDGKINDPVAGSKWWSIEIGIPLKQYVRYERANYPPKNNDLWRIDFSRVEHHIYVHTNPDGSKVYWENTSIPVENWVWQPTYVDPPNMHVPEYWGYLQFSTERVNTSSVNYDKTFYIRNSLMQVYYALTEYYQTNKQYTASLITLMKEAGLPEYVVAGSCTSIPTIQVTNNNGQLGFIVTINDKFGIGHVKEDRFIWFGSN